MSENLVTIKYRSVCLLMRILTDSTSMWSVSLNVRKSQEQRFQGGWPRADESMYICINVEKNRGVSGIRRNGIYFIIKIKRGVCSDCVAWLSSPLIFRLKHKLYLSPTWSRDPDVGLLHLDPIIYLYLFCMNEFRAQMQLWDASWYLTHLLHFSKYIWALHGDSIPFATDITPFVFRAHCIDTSRRVWERRINFILGNILGHVLQPDISVIHSSFVTDKFLRYISNKRILL